MKTITSNYTIKSDDKKLILDSSLESFILTLPESIGLGFEVEMICVGGTESVNSITIESTKETILINGDSAFVIDTDRAVVNLALQNIFGKVVHLSCTQGASGGGGGDTGWTLSLYATTLASDLGIAFDTISTISNDQTYLSKIDTSLNDVSEDISTFEAEGLKIIKNIKVTGPYDLILESTAGFSNGTNQLLVSDSAIIFFDGTIWQILYNNEWKTKVVDVDLGDLISNNAALAGILGKFYDIESITLKYTPGTINYDTTGMDGINITTGGLLWQFNPSILTNTENFYAISKQSTSPDTAAPLGDSVNIGSAANPTLGDGTLQVIIKYKVNTF